jgi:hypothetical protein
MEMMASRNGMVVALHLRLRLQRRPHHVTSRDPKSHQPHWLYIHDTQHQCIYLLHILTSSHTNPELPYQSSNNHTQHTHHNARDNHPTSDSDSTLQLARLVKPTAPAPPHRRNSLLRQNRAHLLPHKLRAAVDRLRRPQAIDPLLRLETQQRRRERASDRQLRRERGDLAAMGGRRWQQS